LAKPIYKFLDALGYNQKDFVVMAWVYLFLAGLLEIGFTSFLKLSDNFTRIIPTIIFLILSVLSFVALSMSLKSIPLGTSYAIWTGIGAFGTALIGILFFGESTEFWRVFFLCLLIGSIIGLKVVS
jgi:quaternary ammonium compound-resistance protein SugE